MNLRIAACAVAAWVAIPAMAQPPQGQGSSHGKREFGHSHKFLGAAAGRGGFAANEFRIGLKQPARAVEATARQPSPLRLETRASETGLPPSNLPDCIAR